MSAELSRGPWTYRRVGNLHGTQNTDVDIYEVFDAKGRALTVPLFKRDARVIANAPAMLEALRRAVLALAFAAESSDAMRDDYEAVSAAIAKATGAA